MSSLDPAKHMKLGSQSAIVNSNKFVLTHSLLTQAKGTRFAEKKNHEFKFFLIVDFIKYV